MPQISADLLHMKGAICTTSLQIPLLKSTSWICNINFLLLGYRHVISVSPCLVLLCWNPLINPSLFSFQGQGIFFLLKPIHGLWRSQSWVLATVAFSYQESEYTFPVFLSLTRNTNIDLILKRHTNSLLFPSLLINSVPSSLQ